MNRCTMTDEDKRQRRASEDPGRRFGRPAGGAALPIATSVMGKAERAVR